MFLALCAKMEKKRGKGKDRGGEESKPASTFKMKIFKEASKTRGRVCKKKQNVNYLYIYIIIYNII